ncbi:TrmB family transcriptional regulator [Candidatus Woesearchaeota archaeon]|jgi:sugar-specific transcriptional regulator TrmB|nr:TrmB family transcriptional regulator [Candidatus Woesearchaeota archaeon]
MISVLQQLGFSEYKARAYSELCRFGTLSALELSKKSNIPSSKIYEVMKWLHENGYVSIISQKPLVYKANNPKKILKTDVESKINDLKEVKKKIDLLTLPLEHMSEGVFQIVYGRNSFFKRVKESISETNNSVIAIVKTWRIDRELFDLTKEAISRGATIRFLGPITKQNQKTVKIWQEMGVLTKHYIPESTRFTVWDGKVMTIGLKEESESKNKKSNKDYVSLWIENKVLGLILTNYFDSLWDLKK